VIADAVVSIYTVCLTSYCCSAGYSFSSSSITGSTGFSIGSSTTTYTTTSGYTSYFGSSIVSSNLGSSIGADVCYSVGSSTWVGSAGAASVSIEVAYFYSCTSVR